MNRLARIYRTTAFKLSLLYLAVFTALSAFLLIYISQNTNQLMLAQVTQTLDAEITGLPEEYARGGVRALVAAIDSRARRPDASLYLLTDFAGNAIAGNITQMPRLFIEEGDGGVQRVQYYRLNAEGEEVKREALIRTFDLRGGYRLLVGRDLGERRHFVGILEEARRVWIGAVVIMAVITWFFVNRRIMKRIDEISATSKTIMEGDLSRRLPIQGTADEFDRLAVNLNDMLERIELLMRGMKDVTDNIAHDLKTPLTRLRGRVETALREAKSEEAYREALEATLGDSENLIRVFDALLRIARIEAMTPEAGMDEINISEIAAEIGELYDPVIEDEGGSLTVDAGTGLVARGNRDLISQVLVNLIENAMKYGRGEDGSIVIEIKAEQAGDRIILGVCDHGQGIPADDRDRVRDRFVRLEESRTAPGYGLGLSLVQAVARLHGGELALRDAQPGLKACIDLPIGKTSKE
ncbi:HAMP domain-containing sensor histidine kinase [Roseibium sediminis]|uniref:HAMP domain-containing sensor histidine kinase n=1 Tax=Roseibium sediminis TaxID=1775174 RepID=UPI00123DB50A|nr:HAMP domain-containing sensor histidine kinase [Roseibium sediminis]